MYKVFYVMVKALSGKISCLGTGLVIVLFSVLIYLTFSSNLFIGVWLNHNFKLTVNGYIVRGSNPSVFLPPFLWDQLL